MALVYSSRHHGLYEALDRSLDPRGPEMLFEAAGAYLQSGSRVLDIGCRDARHLVRLVQAHNCRGVGFDPVDWNLERAQAAVHEAGLGDRIEIRKGVIEQIDDPNDHFDFIWFRDVLEVVEDLEQGLAEAARVLKPEGRMLVYTAFATSLFEVEEAALIQNALGNIPRNLDERFVETAFERAGLAIELKDVIGTEWREYDEERTQPVSRELLRLARLRRRRDAILEEYGQDLYDLAQASLQWKAYQFLGKLQPTMYILKRRTD